MSAQQDILDNVKLLSVLYHCGHGPFLFQHDCELGHKAKSIYFVANSLDEFGVEELYCSVNDS